MFDIYAITLSLFCAYIVYKIINLLIDNYRLPPGPWGLPIVGYAPFLGNHWNVNQLSKKYGPVFSAKMGKHLFVFINDWPSLSQAFAASELLARPHEPLLNSIIDVPSFGEMSGPDWRDQRRLTLHILRDLGFGKTALEEMIKDEYIELIDKLKSLADTGKAVNLREYLVSANGNISGQLIFGRRFDYNEPIKQRLDYTLGRVATSFKFHGLHLIMPWLAPLMRLFSKDYQNFRELVIENQEVLDKILTEKEKSGLNGQFEDYITEFMLKIEERKSKGENLGTFNRETALRNMVFVYGAAAETGTTTGSWIMLYLVKYPHFQEKIRQELERVVGNRMVCHDDHKRMPFTYAFIHEVLRTRPPLVLNLLRRASADVKISGQLIPKDSLVAFNIWGINMDEKLWKDPDTFDPHRFLSADESKFEAKPYLVTFSGGKRVCPGESMAKIELFYFTALLLQNFKLTVPNGVQVSDEQYFSAVVQPKSMPEIVLETIQ